MVSLCPTLRGQNDLRESMPGSYQLISLEASLCLSFPVCKLGKLKVFCLYFLLQPHSVCPGSSEIHIAARLPLSNESPTARRAKHRLHHRKSE